VRLIALANVKNEEWIIERWLKRSAEFSDGIIVLDDGSTDATLEKITSNNQVNKIIQNPPGQSYNMVANRNRLLNESRKYNPEWIFFLDADEIMDQRLGDRISKLMDAPDVGRYYFQEITLWRSTKQYRVDKPGEYMRVHHGFPVLVRMTPSLVWKHSDRMSLKRTLWLLIKKRIQLNSRRTASALMGVRGKTVELNDLVKLHYHFVNWERSWQRHMSYALRKSFEENKKIEHIPEIVEWASRRMNEDGLKMETVKPEWGVL